MSKKSKGRMIGTMAAIAGVIAIGTVATGGAALRTIVEGLKATGCTVKEALEKIQNEEKEESKAQFEEAKARINNVK